MWGCACCRCYNATWHLLFYLASICFCTEAPQPMSTGGGRASRPTTPRKVHECAQLFAFRAECGLCSLAETGRQQLLAPPALANCPPPAGDPAGFFLYLGGGSLRSGYLQ